METPAIEAGNVRSLVYETGAWEEVASFDRESDTPLAFPYKKLLLKQKLYHINYEMRFETIWPDCMQNGFRKYHQRTLSAMHLNVQSK